MMISAFSIFPSHAAAAASAAAASVAADHAVCMIGLCRGGYGHENHDNERKYANQRSGVVCS